jgi:hypothetical protein
MKTLLTAIVEITTQSVVLLQTVVNDALLQRKPQRLPRSIG